jgi:VanZ family protein
VGVTIAIVILSLVPPPTDIQSAGQSDKIFHFFAYFGLAGTLTYATIELRSRPQIRALFIFAGAVGISLGVELLQAILPYRYFTLGDLLANVLGAGLMLLWFPVEQYVDYVSLAEYLDITSDND